MIPRLAAIAAPILRTAFAPPEKLDICEWADKYRVIARESGAAQWGPYKSHRVPYAREPMHELSNRRNRRVVLLWGAQLTKSTIFENAIGQTIDLYPRSMLVVQPTVEYAEVFSKERFTTMVDATPRLAKKVHTARSRDSNNTLRYKTYPGGFMAIVGSNAPSGLAGRAISDIYADELDRWKDSAGTEGDQLKLAEARQTTFSDGRTAIASTPGNEETTRIVPLYKAGDQRKYFVPCPHCGAFQTLDWGPGDEPFGLKWVAGKPETAEYLCVECAALIPHRAKRRMIAAGEWRRTNPDGSYPSFFLHQLYSVLGHRTWAAIATEYLESKDNPEQYKVFVNTVLCQTYRQQGQQIETHELLARLEDYEAEIPAGVALLTAGVDVQDDRLELRTWGWGAEQESWLLRVEQIPGDPGVGPTQGVWKELTRIRREAMQHASGAMLMPKRTLIDTGYHTSAVYAYCREFAGEGVIAGKGIKGDGIHILGKPNRRSNARVLVYPVGTFAAKEKFLLSQLRIPIGKPGCVHLPKWVTVEELQGLTSEMLTERLVRGRRRREWVVTAKNRRNEPLDDRVYAMAALHSLGAPILRDLGKLAEQLMARSKQESAQTAAPRSADEQFDGARRRPQRGYVDRWKD